MTDVSCFTVPLTEAALAYALGEFGAATVDPQTTTLVVAQGDFFAARRIVQTPGGPLTGACQIRIDHTMPSGQWEVRL